MYVARRISHPPRSRYAELVAELRWWLVGQCERLDGSGAARGGSRRHQSDRRGHSVCSSRPHPTAGAILCAQAGWGGAGGVGHVAVVLDPSVGSDGKVAIEQCNWNYCLCYSHGRFAARGAGIRFIHIGQLAAATTATTAAATT